jgi:hypothetical protein
MSKKHDHGHHDHDDHHHHNHHGEIHPHQLEPPHEVFHDAKAGEVARVWVCDGHLSLSLHAMAFGKADIWGHVLSGIAGQVAAAMSEMGHGTTAENLDIIRKTLTENLNKSAAAHSVLSNKG